MSPTRARIFLPLLVLVVLLVALLPYLASTNLVRERIAQQVSSWTGYRVTLSQAPDIDVFPSLKAVLRGVTVYSWGEVENPIMESDRVEVGLSLLSAFRGDADITGFTLLRPQFHPRRNENGSWHMPIPAGGELSYAIRTALRAIESDGDKPLDSDLLAAKIGSFKIIDGQVTLDGTSGNEDALTSLDATITWPTLERPLNIMAKAIWRGEAISFGLASPAPLSGLSRKPMPVSLKFEAAPVAVNFDGTLSLSNDIFYEGKAQFNFSSFKRALSWYGEDVPALQTVGALSLSGTVNGDRQRMRLEDAKIGIGETNAIGFLDIHNDADAAAISGTLAFDRIDIMAFLSAFGDVPGSAEKSAERIDLSYFDKLNLDLRLSATEADAGPIMLSNIAANVQVKSDIAAFDVSGAQAFDGNIQASLRLDRDNDANGGEIRILGSDISGAKLATALKIERYVPNAPLDLSVILNGPTQSWKSLVRAASGTVTAHLDAGTIIGFDLNGFISKLSSSGFFPFGQTIGVETAFDAIDVKVAVVDGVAQIEKAVMTSGNRHMSITGLVAPFSSSIALSGLLEEDVSNKDAATHIFFLGGAPDSPFVTPILPSVFPSR